MNMYLQNLLPRLKEFGQKLNKIEQLVERVWVVADSDEQSVTYRFLRDNRLLITVNGDVEEGEWNYLKPESLYLKFGSEKKMFSQGFLLNEVLILQRQANDSTPFLLYDSKLGSLADLQFYIQEKYLYHNSLKSFGDFYFSQTAGYDIPQLGDSIYDKEFNLVLDPELTTSKRILKLDNGRVNRIFYINKFLTDSGEIELHGSDPSVIEKGDKFISNEQIAYQSVIIKENDLYKEITIENNTVVDIKLKLFRGEILSAIFVVLVLIMIVYLLYSQGRS